MKKFRYADIAKLSESLPIGISLYFNAYRGTYYFGISTPDGSMQKSTSLYIGTVNTWEDNYDRVLERAKRIRLESIFGKHEKEMDGL